MYTVDDISGILSSNSSVVGGRNVIKQIAIDSRKINFPSTTLFFALNGLHHNGHIYIGGLYTAGVRSFVVSEPVQQEDFPGANFFVVHDTLAALQSLAAFHRKRFDFPVIGITGSNGKTIVKEWLFHLLNDQFEIVRSPKSYNSQVGVPLSLWQIDTMHNLGIFEAGISRPAEMPNLQKMIEPQLGIFTFLGKAHAEGFKDMQQKAKEKLQLFTDSDVLFYCADEALLHEAVLSFKKTKNPTLQLFSWGKHSNATIVVKDIRSSRQGSYFSLGTTSGSSEFFIPFTDEASIHNAITCVTVLLFLNIPVEHIKEKLLQLRPLAMRLELKQGINNCSVINDSYSADLNSLTIALDFLEQQQQHPLKTVILSDFVETGEQATVLYRDIAALLEQKKLHRFIGIGPQLAAHADLFNDIPNATFYPSTPAFLKSLPSFHFAGESILLKGARMFAFEKISSALEQKMHQTVLEINLNALRHNVKMYRQQLHPGVKIMCMVKAFSYGSGSYEIANLLQHAGVEYLGVAYADEGVELRKAGIKLPIMVLNTEEAGFDHMIAYQLEPELYSFKILESFSNYLLQQNIESHGVHIKIDTGMHRLGFDPSEIGSLCQLLKQNDRLKILSVFSHLAGGGEAIHDQFTLKQANLLKEAVHTIKEVVGYDFATHIANSSAIHRHRELQLSMVRLGIGMYGIDADTKMQDRLQNVTTLKTTISQVKKIKQGESIGYSRSAVASEDKVIATVRIGYADGYPRILSNGVGYMLVNGMPAPVIGKICMDMTMLDITGIEAEEEDEVIVFGEALPVHNLALWAQTIEYEILTNISQRVRRVYFEE